ncbi:unnamed protein product [Caenorhabditis auriculariae]|uniref:Uncharacterized protein n=1 Tax=Caenorhabditis auriculariae TaxID=2777116 RepID=A0A8S1H780_9PELO|nr:unnamed protein product [Caenorhabditis auriculariae]
MADNEIRQRRVHREKKEERSSRVYKVEKPEPPTNWFFVIGIILLIFVGIIVLVDVVRGGPYLRRLWNFLLRFGTSTNDTFWSYEKD